MVGCPSLPAGKPRVRETRSGGPARPGSAGRVLREPAGPPEGLPHQGLLVVDALERAGGAPHCGHRDHHILVLLWLASHHRARGQTRTEITRCLPAPAVSWLSRSEWTPSRLTLRRPLPHGVGAVFPLPPSAPVAAKTWPRWAQRPPGQAVRAGGPGDGDFAGGTASLAVDHRTPGPGGQTASRDQVRSAEHGRRPAAPRRPHIPHT